MNANEKMLIETRMRKLNFLRPVVRVNYDVNIDLALRRMVEIGRMRSPKFVIDEQNRDVYRNVLLWLMGNRFTALHPDTRNPIEGNPNAGLYIAGNTGSGKSWLVDLLAIFSDVYNIKFLSNDEQRMLAFRPVLTVAVCQQYADSGKFDNYLNSPVAAFQDLGAEDLETLYMGNRRNVMKTILEARADNDSCFTIITSNLPLCSAELLEMYGDRVVSRLKQLNYFELKGKDRRC